MKKLIALFRDQRINIFKTLIFNFRAFPFRIAIKLPVYIYTDTLLRSIGKVYIDTEHVHGGMIRIGKRNFFVGFKTQFINSGEIHFQGKFLIESGTCLNNSGIIVLGKESRFCERCNVLIVNKLEIGSSTQIAFETVIMDTDFHTIVNINKKIAKKSFGDIYIGAYNWIGNRSMIKKSTRTDDYTIVSSLSMLNKDYRSEERYPLIAGCPAKIIARGWRRIYSDKNNRLIDSYFRSSTSDVYEVESVDRLDWDDFCLHGDEILRF